MSAVEYAKCDAECCDRVTHDDPREAWPFVEGWSRLVTSGKTYDLCPECTRKALEAVGLE